MLMATYIVLRYMYSDNTTNMSIVLNEQVQFLISLATLVSHYRGGGKIVKSCSSG